jgi:ribosomal protein S18 acetylase RimI-like enzyme
VTAIARFQTECWREAYRGLVPDSYLDGVSEEDRATRWRERIESRSRQAAIAWHGEDVAGVVSWGAAESGEPDLELKSLYVHANHRGTGLAERLAVTAIGHAAAQLWVFEANERARNFYRKLGFVPTGDRKIDPDTRVWEVRLRRDQSEGIYSAATLLWVRATAHETENQ